MVAYVRDNNLYIMALNSLKETQVTFDGKFNEVINGTTDWVKIEAITREVPDGIVRAYIQPWAKKCVSGRAVIDNIYIA